MFAARRVSKESQSSEARSVVDTKIHLVQIRKYIWFKYKNTFSSNTNISTSRCHNRGRTKIIWNPIYKETTFPLSFPISEINVFPYRRSMCQPFMYFSGMLLISHTKYIYSDVFLFIYSFFKMAKSTSSIPPHIGNCRGGRCSLFMTMQCFLVWEFLYMNRSQNV